MSPRAVRVPRAVRALRTSPTGTPYGKVGAGQEASRVATLHGAAALNVPASGVPRGLVLNDDTSYVCVHWCMLKGVAWRFDDVRSFHLGDLEGRRLGGGWRGNAGRSAHERVSRRAALRCAAAPRRHAKPAVSTDAPDGAGVHLQHAGPCSRRRCAGAQERPPHAASDADALRHHARLRRWRPSGRLDVGRQVHRCGREPSGRDACPEWCTLACPVAVSQQQQHRRRRTQFDLRGVPRRPAGAAQGALTLAQPAERPCAGGPGRSGARNPICCNPICSMLQPSVPNLHPVRFRWLREL